MAPWISLNPPGSITALSLTVNKQGSEDCCSFTFFFFFFPLLVCLVDAVMLFRNGSGPLRKKAFQLLQRLLACNMPNSSPVEDLRMTSKETRTSNWDASLNIVMNDLYVEASLYASTFLEELAFCCCCNLTRWIQVIQSWNKTNFVMLSALRWHSTRTNQMLLQH